MVGDEAQNDLTRYRETLKIIDAMKDEPLTNRVFVEGMAVLIERLTREADGRDCEDPECENERVGIIGTAWEKGERLAKLIARRTLLILDGLEPLQNPPGAQEGRLRDPSQPRAGTWSNSPAMPAQTCSERWALEAIKPSSEVPATSSVPLSGPNAVGQLFERCVRWRHPLWQGSVRTSFS
jgi:hypothetical protein